jgi:hypothetical protein
MYVEIFTHIVHYFTYCCERMVLFVELSHTINQDYWVSGLCPSSGILNNRRTQRFGNWICFRPQVRWQETPTQLTPLERASQWSSD